LSIIGKYVEWAEQKPTRKAVVVYDTMWHSTETMADALADALGEEGVRVKLMHLRSCHRSDVITEIHDAGAVLVGSPTINNQMFPTVADMLCYMKGLKPLNKVGAAFGSYGWSGEAVKYVNAELTAMKFNVVSPGVRSPFVPEDDIMRAMADLGRMVASALPPAP
jgi:flavorubredoxin